MAKSQVWKWKWFELQAVDINKSSISVCSFGDYRSALTLWLSLSRQNQDTIKGFKRGIWRVDSDPIKCQRGLTWARANGLNISTHLRMCDGECGEQVCEGSQMWTVFWACIVRMCPVRPQHVFKNIPTDKLEVLVADPGRPLALQLVILPRLPLHVVHSFLSTQSVRVDVQEVPPNNLTHQHDSYGHKTQIISFNIWKHDFM